ncbi:glycoside hydrolase family 3 protein [Thiospirochaeta perfilievii]|uniref:beta-N-acetylhexosaminidase n=1 Tax=Thiospirochaeta perfilievii TaxID=252967 RepID=A0A5C1QFK3_9SPIO|nr:glycoside hydrolase family 3 protein [Thiospirochaeta perfilievii]QEN05366.1 glycoside hydrolase family 3 protein [Thiospirochaeta perfilievii]
MIDPKKIISEMTLREKIAQTFLQYYQGYDDLPENLLELNRKNELGNLLFFSGANVRDLDQLHKMSINIQSHAKENRFNLPFLLTIDQEGGQLTAIHRGTTMFPGNMALGFANDESLTSKQGSHCGKELKYAGINICYAPVLDVSYDRKDTPIVDNRMYSSNPQVVADMGSAYIKGLQDEGVAACGKHFPGMRLTQEDTHFKCDTHPGDMNRLVEVELAPYKKAIESGLEVVMTHHGVFSALDTEYPASMSKKWYDYLRKDMGFKGLTVTDDLIMGAVRSQYGDEDAVIIALAAGADLLMHTALSSNYVDVIEQAVKDGRVTEERITEAATRVLEYKAKFCTTTPENKTFSKTDGDALAYEIAKKSLIKYKGDDSLFPIKLEEKDQVGVIFANPARLVMSDAINLYDPLSIRETIKNRTKHSLVKEAFMPWRPTHMEQVSVGDIAFITDVCIFTTVNAYCNPEQIETLKYTREICPNKTIIGVATRGPKDAELLAPYCDAVIVTGGLSQVSIDALVDGIFEHGEFDSNPAKEI